MLQDEKENKIKELSESLADSIKREKNSREKAI
jgi:hypothetical protein